MYDEHKANKEIENKMGKELSVYYEEDSKSDSFEDDGFIHVQRGHIRYVIEGTERRIKTFEKVIDKVLASAE